MLEGNAARAIGRELDAILTSFDTNYVWNYGDLRAGLHDLYEKAKREQWNSSERLAWNTDVDPEGDVLAPFANPIQDWEPYKKLSAKQQRHYQHAFFSWQLSQFMHGEQGALITASQLVAAVPWIDAKYYASTQTMDEARHVEVFSRYLREKLAWEWPVNPNLKQLLDIILKEGRWDFKYLGMQILVEGLAMAAFGNMYQMAREPLLRDIIRYVMRDEARHVAFGVLSLQDFYTEMPESERKDREDFIIEACLLMRDRLVGEEVADVFGFDRAELREAILESELMRQFRVLLFTRVVPNIKKLGLLTPRVRKAFTEFDIIRFENFDTAAADRALGLQSL